MRKRVTLLFVLVVIALAAFGYVLRTWTVEQKVRDHDGAVLHQQAVAIATAVAERAKHAEPVDADFLRGLLAADMAVRFRSFSGDVVDVRGPGFDGALGAVDRGENLWAIAPASGWGDVLVSEDEDVVRDTAWDSREVMLLILVAVGALAALVLTLIGRAYERPFLRLAEAAAALGRGRFQLDLRPGRMPAANAIARALEASAQQLADRMATEEELAQRASHVLRTPLTGLRLELEEAALEEDLRPETAAALERSLQRVDQLDAVTGELVALARHRALVADAAVELDLLARQVTQRWTADLGTRDRALTSSVEGQASTTYTPGPVEQILELLLADVVHRTGGDVGLVFAAAVDGHLRITVTADSSVPVRKANTAPLLRARTVALALGGRLEGEYAEGGVEIVLPRR